MGIVRGHAGIGHVAEHLLVVADLELLRVRIEAEASRRGEDSLIPRLQFLDGKRSRHGASRLGGVFPCALAGEKALEGGPYILFALDLDCLKIVRLELGKEL